MSALPAGPVTWVSELLAKALLRKGNTSSVSNFMAWASAQAEHSRYIIKVLEAPVDTRIAVRNAAIANIATSGSEGQKQLVCILTLFEALSLEDKTAFLIAFKANATLAGQGPESVILNHVYQPGHVPPVLPP